MTARALTARVHDLGAAVGLVGLSAHDLRHYWATRAARSGTPLDRLAGRRRVGVAGDAAAVCGGGDDREPGGAARGAGVGRGGQSPGDLCRPASARHRLDPRPVHRPTPRN